MYSQIAANKRKTFFMMVLFVMLIAGLGFLFAVSLDQPMITPYVLVGAAVYVLITYFAGSKMALAMNGAHQIEKKDNPRLWRIVENLSITEGLPMPKVYIIQDPAPNAFATGRDPYHAVVAATSGILELLDDQELEGVMAHELGHVKNYDVRVSMIAFALVAVVSIMADLMFRWFWLRGRDDNDNGVSAVQLLLGSLAAVLAPIIASMIQLSISRKREYLADATGALTTRYPEGLARALEKISQHGSVMQRQNPSTAHLFFANPLKAKGVSKLFSTHPPIEERISRLRSMGRHE